LRQLIIAPSRDGYFDQVVIACAFAAKQIAIVMGGKSKTSIFQILQREFN
jgi:hypothetical protein